MKNKLLPLNVLSSLVDFDRSTNMSVMSYDLLCGLVFQSSTSLEMPQQCDKSPKLSSLSCPFPREHANKF